MENINLYDVLQVSPNAENEIIEAAYKKLAFKYHPDRHDGFDANEKMKNINLAYSVLHDPIKRREYDKRQDEEKKQMMEMLLGKDNEKGVFKSTYEDSAEERIKNARKILDKTGSVGWMLAAYFIFMFPVMALTPEQVRQYAPMALFVFLFVINVISNIIRNKLLTKEERNKEREELENETIRGR